jgi:hypothetical protein
VAPSVPTVVPSSFRAGDTVRFTRGYADFPAGDGWTAKLTLAGPSKVSVDASASGNDFSFTLTAAQTANLLPGTYTLQVTAALSGARYTAESAVVTVEADVQAATAGALEHQDEKELRLLNAELLARAENDHTEYAIDGRSLKRESLESLRAWRDTLRERIAQRRRGTVRMAAVRFPARGVA